MARERRLSFLWHSLHAALIGLLVALTVVGWKWSYDHRAADVEVHLV